MPDPTQQSQRTHVIIDGLQDPVLARDLSARWMAAGFRNAVDIAGQCAWLERDADVDKDANVEGNEHDESIGDEKNNENAAIVDRPLNEEDVARAGGIARAFGVEIRDRAGKSFVAANQLPALREQMIYEYRTRFAQSLVFGLPAVILHYIGPVLAVGGGESASNMLYPWMIEMVLVGWALWAGGLPILWQGVMSALHLRTTADLLTTAIVFAAFIPSLIGVVSVIFGHEPWFNSGQGSTSQAGPTFHVAMLAIMLALFQRWRMFKHAHRLTGRASLMMPRFNRLCAAWIVAMFVAMFVFEWRTALGVGLLMPALLSAGGINKLSPGWSMALPVLAFVPLFLFGDRFTNTQMDGIRIEVAVGFQLLMAVVFAISWSKWPTRNEQSA